MIQGIYHPNNEVGPDRSTLTINQNHTFLFVNFSDILGTKTSVGTWQVKNNLLNLKRDSIKISDTFIKVIEKVGHIGSKTIIHVVDAADNRPVVGANIGINEGRMHYTVDTTGIINIDSAIFLKSIYFSYVSIQKKLNISNHYAKDVTLIIKFDDVPVVGQLTIPKIWVINKNKLIPLSADGFVKSSDNVYVKSDPN